MTTLCGVRRVKKGEVTIFSDRVHAAKTVEAAERRERNRIEGIADWEATLEPVHLDAKSEPYVADADVVLGPSGTLYTFTCNPYH